MKNSRLLLLGAAVAIATSLGQQQPPVRTLVPDLTIGGPDEARDDYTFDAISGLAFSPDGRILVTDLKDNVVRLYDSSGTFRYKFGGSGAGPGEFRFAISGVFAPDGLFWVRDEGNRRWNAFQLGATLASYRTSVRFEERSFNRYDPVGIGPDGRLHSTRLLSTVCGEHRPGLVTHDISGKLLRTDTIALPPRDSLGDRIVTRSTTVNGRANAGCNSFFYYQPYGSEFTLTMGPRGEYARAVTGRYDIEWHDASGRLLRHIQRSVTGPRLTAKERDAARKRIDEFVEDFKVARSDIPDAIPDTKAPITLVQFDQLGRLWVKRSVPEGAASEADLYDANGKWIAIVRWAKGEANPFDPAIIAARRNRILATVSDSLGVSWVRRFKLE